MTEVRLKTAAVTSLFKYYPLPEALRVIAEAGCDGVELWGGFPHAFVEDFYDGQRLDAGLLASCRQLVADAGLAPVAYLPEQCFYPVNYLVDTAPPFDGARLRARSVAYFERAIEVAAELEFPLLVVTTPFWGWHKSNGGFAFRGDKAIGQVSDVLGGLARAAERRGVVLVLEPLTRLETTSVETLDDLVAVLDAVASPALAAMLDMGHVNVTARLLGRDPASYFAEHVERLGGRLRHLHVNDNKGDSDAHLLPGEGNFDFTAACRALKKAGYQGYLSAEIMMFGPNPVPPMPAELLSRTFEQVRKVWNA
ncbi:MAG: TIM barrel protein [Rhodospirillales bacterium]|nr:TIM barrel protein [Rhodospirillales bacterium]